ncbi:MAG: hypothetical protein ACTSW1_14935 [Candidatus Hodarchaeales archaeon]
MLRIISLNIGKRLTIESFLILVFILIPIVNLNSNNSFNSDSFSNYNTFEIDNGQDVDVEETSKTDFNNPMLKLQSFQTPKILFIVGDPNTPNPQFDTPFHDFLVNNLSYGVVYHDDNNSYQNYQDYDAILISKSIKEADTVDSLYRSEIPILIMEAGTEVEFQMGSGFGTNILDPLYIINNSHYITENLTQDNTFNLYISQGDVDYIRSYNAVPEGTEIVELALPSDLPSVKNYRSLLALDKGDNDWNNTPASERRAFWGATDGSLLNQQGWYLWNQTLNWVLYDDRSGNTTLTINVKDLAEENVNNSQVTIIDSYNSSNIWIQNTSIIGSTTFTNIPFGFYNITVEFEGVENSTFSFLEIGPEKTWQSKAFFEYEIILELYIDDTPPVIQNISFDNSTYTFYADILDSNQIQSVFLNLTAINISTQEIIISGNFSMVLKSEPTYYNDTALDPLNNTDVEIQYTINATDIAGNIAISPLEVFSLDDPIPPQINEYGITDYGNGTLVFYANITDESGVESVTLKLNESYVTMSLNQSDFWVYREEFYFGSIWNYTVWSTKDNLGNENGSVVEPLNPPFKLVVVTDTMEPQIWGVQHTFYEHDKGQVEFTVLTDDWNVYQSQVNHSSVTIILEINGENHSAIMSPIGDITYFFVYNFSYSDIVYFWIQASDIANNINYGLKHGPFNITDNIAPSLSYWAFEWGNGTIDFYSEVIDWPDNETQAYLLYTTNYPTSWINISMISLNDTIFHLRILDFEYQEQDIWYYVSAKDKSGNFLTPTQDESFNISLSDKICPEITYISIENSTTEDGYITIYVRAEDLYGLTNLVNNTFYLKYITNSTTNTVEMNYYSFYTYMYTVSFPYKTVVNLSIWVNDYAGNVGFYNKTITIEDYSPPKILRHGSIVFQNGSVSIWAEVYESIYGSGLLTDNSSVTLSYIYQSTVTVTMNWNGTVNFYSFLISGFQPGKAFTYRIHVFDNVNNTNQTDWQPVTITDETTPQIDSIDSIQHWLDHYTVNISFIVSAYDLFGEIDSIFINITVRNQTILEEMTQITETYYFTISLPCQINLSYQITVFDTWGNYNQSTSFNISTLDYNPASFSSYGVEYNKTSTGSIYFWTFIKNPWKDHNVTITLSTDGNTLISDEFMEYNGSLYIYDITLPYNSTYNCTMRLSDMGVKFNYYNASEVSISGKIEDRWAPEIVNVQIFQNEENKSVIIWVNVTDFGTGVKNVTLMYEFSAGGSASSSNHVLVKRVVMVKYNSTHYKYTINNTPEGTLIISIIAYDFTDFSSILNKSYPIFKQGQNTPLGALEMLLAITVTMIFISSIFVSIMIYQKKRKRSRERVNLHKTILEAPNTIYRILVTTAAGIPALTLTNVIYQQNQDQNVTLSGVSVSIDTFLESFQTDFLDQVSATRTVMSETEKARMSLIEQNKVNVLIGATESFRLFVFFNVKPDNLTRKAFQNAIIEIQEKLPLDDLGIIDDMFLGPEIKKIISRHFPVVLLSKFVIDVNRLRELEERLQYRKYGLSKHSINLLKRIVSIRASPSLGEKDPKTQIKFFWTEISNRKIAPEFTFIYPEVITIASKILGASVDTIYEAIWKGASESTKILRETT